MYTRRKDGIYNRLNTKPHKKITVHKKSLRDTVSDALNRYQNKYILLRTLPCFCFAVAIAFSIAGISTYTKHHSYYPQKDTYVISSKFAAKNESLESSAGDDGKFTVSLKIGNSIISAETNAVTVGEFLDDLNIDTDKHETDLSSDTLLSGETFLTLHDVDYIVTTAEEVIPYETESEYTQSIPVGTTKVKREGVNGSRTVTYREKVVDGQPTGQTETIVISESAPINAQVVRGEGGSFVGSDGVTYHYSYYIDVLATAYVAPEHAITASGEEVSTSVIAVDPTVIDLGTKVYVSSDYYDPGVRYALDTGGGIKGKIIDVFMGCDNTAYNNAIQWGVRDARVYVLLD